MTLRKLFVSALITSLPLTLFASEYLICESQHKPTDEEVSTVYENLLANGETEETASAMAIEWLETQLEKHPQIMVMKKSSVSGYKLLLLTLSQVYQDNLTSPGAPCHASVDGPIGGVRGRIEQTCDLSDGKKAFIKFSKGGEGSVLIVSTESDQQSTVESFNEFSCY